ncbi:MAG: hypothetical protein IKL85_04795 [Lentisphaeria bacterium]|nr:hypothetical protein [Lentisphaeria bacterium]
MTRYGIPEIFNSDPGSQFTSKEFTDELKAYGISFRLEPSTRTVPGLSSTSSPPATSQMRKLPEKLTLHKLREGIPDSREELRNTYGSVEL